MISIGKIAEKLENLMKVKLTNFSDTKVAATLWKWLLRTEYS